MSALYELTAEFLELMEMLEDEECDEQIIMDTLEGIDYEIELKADNYAKIIKNMKSITEAQDKEIARLTARKNTFENRIKWLQKQLEMCMRLTGKTKFKTDLFSFNIQKNGGKRALVVDVDISQIPEKYHIKQPDKLDGELLRDYLKDNGIENEDGRIVCDWCHLEPQSESLRIK